MSTYPRYTDEFRASAVLMAEAAGYPDKPGALSRVARHLSIPRQTLQRWARGTQNPPPHELVTVKKKGLVELLDAVAFGAVSEVQRRIENNEVDLVSIPQLMTAAGIAIDKHQLLTGNATERTENTNVNVTWTHVDYRADLPGEDKAE